MGSAGAPCANGFTPESASYSASRTSHHSRGLPPAPGRGPASRVSSGSAPFYVQLLLTERRAGSFTLPARRTCVRPCPSISISFSTAPLRRCKIFVPRYRKLNSAIRRRAENDNVSSSSRWSRSCAASVPKGGRHETLLPDSRVMTLAAGCDDSPTEPSGPSMSFFVTSATSVTGNLGGLAGADATCQRLAVAAGQGSRTWRAYLSVERDPANGNQPTNARDRIGTGPGTTPASRSSPTMWPSCMRGPVTRPCSSTSVGSASTASGPARRLRSSTTC